jgi:hypothetical protein
MGSAVMRALHSSYNPFRLLRTSPGKGGSLGLEHEQVDGQFEDQLQQGGATVHMVGA